MSAYPKGCGFWIAWGRNGGWGVLPSRYFFHLGLGRLAIGYMRADVDVLIGERCEQIVAASAGDAGAEREDER